jgi:hypothetical protein
MKMTESTETDPPVNPTADPASTSDPYMDGPVDPVPPVTDPYMDTPKKPKATPDPYMDTPKKPKAAPDPDRD